ncbi:MAG: hypothetical protein ABI556_08385 [Gemmatimonadales bacterium]
MLAEKVRQVAARLDPRPLLRRVEWRRVGKRLDPRPIVRRVDWSKLRTSLDPRRLRPYFSLGDDLDDRATVVVGGCIASMVLGALYWASRIGFDNPVTPVLEVVGMSMFILATPLWLMRFSQGSRVVVAHWSASQPALMLLCIALMAMFGMLAHATSVALAPWLAIPGGVFALLTIVFWLRRARVISTFLYLLGSVWFTVWTAGVVWGSRYKMPLYWETFMLRGDVHHDPFYMTSMSSMLETYGVASIGIDGIPVAHYHYGAAWLFTKWAHLIGTDALSFYSLGYPVIVIPAFFAAIVLLAIEIRGVLPPESERALRSDYRVWLVLVAATIGLIPTDALDGLAIWNANVFISESYLIAVPVFMLVVGAGIAFWKSDAYRAVAAEGSEGVEVQPARTQQTAAMSFLLAFLPLMLLLLGFLKLSLMLLCLSLILYIAFRLGLWRRWSVGLSLALCVIVSALTYPVVAVAAQNGGISPFNFMRYDVAEGWQQFFPLLNLIWTWVYIAGRFWEDRITTARELGLAIRSAAILDVELVFLVALVGFLPGELVSIHGGSAVYFSDVQRWFALAFIISRVGTWARKWRAIRHSQALRAQPSGGWRDVRLSTILRVFVAAPFVITLLLNSINWPKRVVRANIALRTEIATKGGGGLITDPRVLKRGVARTTYYPLVTALRDIASLPLEERRASALFIPQTYRDYWGMFDSDERCTYVSLVAPSVSTVAMIDGMPAYGCKVTEQYNMSSYTPRRRPQVAADITSDALCRKARAAGFSEVLVLAPDKIGVPRRSRIACGS